jgi:hypothetical protein
MSNNENNNSNNGQTSQPQPVPSPTAQATVPPSSSAREFVNIDTSSNVTMFKGHSQDLPSSKKK